MKAKLLQKIALKDVEPEWRQQPVEVNGKTFLMGAVKGGKLYHGTCALLVSGDMLDSGHGRNFKQSRQGVSMTSDVYRAQYWASKVQQIRLKTLPAVEAGEPHVYEVEPLGAVTGWRVGLADFGKSFTVWECYADKARILSPVKVELP